MPESLPITPYVPQYITVHLGAPGSNAENVTVSFPEYVKNVASSEIYPTWEPAALRANILAIISFALNRVYTEFYPSRGYPFNITSSTAYDQKFIKGRNIFENISQLVDEIFNSYIRRIGFVEPLAAKFCNGTTVTCDGLSQWGSQALAEEGRDYMSILRSYYGDNIELVTNAPVRGIRYSYPGYPIRRGDSGEAVQRIQVMLNRISRDYPAIPKVYPVDGIFGSATEGAVKKFQQIFDLTPDGIVGNSTWYKMVFLYVGVLDLAELISQGQTYYPGSSGQSLPNVLREGDRGEPVKVIQYVLSVVAEFYNNIPAVAIDGIYGPATKNAVIAVQRMAGLTQDGIMGPRTWAALYRLYAGIVDTVGTYTNVIPEQFRPDLPESQATGLTQYPGQPMTLGSADQRGAAS
ncbi:peptidoglycan-binding protein [Intestinimonas massiliensis (ex Afouda et al. 2020)]|uniref:peptidoglycan-binding protein n=1 Tax=Intestinimonas massiliensis (ex Afouda et al. 2020) TaxID=1673721 RepID=UPI00103020DB|nr:peptidoglycan-binding protein [Intestinimonas massiliensis (ex Afouda et al. 2020)]